MMKESGNRLFLFPNKTVKRQKFLAWNWKSVNFDFKQSDTHAHWLANYLEKWWSNQEIGSFSKWKDLNWAIFSLKINNSVSKTITKEISSHINLNGKLQGSGKTLMEQFSVLDRTFSRCTVYCGSRGQEAATLPPVWCKTFLDT